MIAYKPPTWSPARRPKLGDIVQEAKQRLPELKEPLEFLAVGGAWAGLDFVGHQLLEVTKGGRTAPGYWSNKLIWAIPFLLAGRLLSDYVVKGSDFARALTIGTTANLLMQGKYLMSYSKEFNITVLLLHEAILVPLCFLIVGPTPATGFTEKSP